MEKEYRPARFCDLNPHDVRMLVFDETSVTVHLKNGGVLRDEFPSNKALGEALSFWAKKGELFTDSQGPRIESAARPPAPPPQ
jgi:hypothetical protein